MTASQAEKQKTQDLNIAIKAEINSNKVNIDRKCFQKTQEEKDLLKRYKSSCK